MESFMSTSSRLQGKHILVTAPLDVLFNCAGMVHNGSILECDDADWAMSFELNVTSMHRMIRALSPARTC
jgi:2-keto-3-deoxy-L-fuconate dehydrogenase